jgi:glycerol dehydrogenase
MISTTLFPGRYVQGFDVLRRLGLEMRRFGQSAFMISDPFVCDAVLPDVRDDISREIDLQVECFGGECTDAEIDRLAGAADRPIIGIGGGKTLDTAKAVAHKIGVPVAIVPTTAATDAPCSALSVIYNPDGSFNRYLVLPKNPDLVMVDTRVIANAPVRFLVSGMGDALATWFEAESVQAKHGANMTGDGGSMTAYALAKLCYKTLLEYGLLAKLACEVHAVTPAFERIVEANTLLSGLGFESGGLAASHAIHNGLTVLEGSHNYYHGEKVAFGTLASLFLTGRPTQVVDTVYSFCESTGLPTTLAAIGLQSATDDDLMKVASAACAEGETIHNEPTPVTPQAVVSALKAADVTGRRRLEQPMRH